MEIRARTLREPLVASFTIAYGSQAAAETIVVEAVSRGVRGLGEAAPSPSVTGEALESSMSYIRWVAEKLRGLELPQGLAEALHVIHRGRPWFPAARAALESAVVAAAAALAGLDETVLLAPRAPQGRLYTDYTIGIPPASVLEELRRSGDSPRLREAVEYIVGLRGRPPEEPVVPVPPVNGFTVLKVKLGTGDPGLDLALARLVYEASRGRARIRVDANQAWSPKTAVRLVRKLESLLGDLLELVEQPVPWQHLEGLAHVRRSVETPVAADEPVKTPEDVYRVARLEAADVVNIKLAKAGGPLEAQRLVAAAEAAGLEVMWGCMVETGLGIAHAGLAAAASGHTSILDLDSPLFLRRDPFGRYAVYKATPLGVELEPRTPAEPPEGAGGGRGG